jgi:hypothetical protein
MKEGKRHNLDVHPNLLFFTIITHIWRWFFRYGSRDNKKVVNLIEYERDREMQQSWQIEFGLLSFLRQYHLHDIDEQSSDVPHV